MARQCQQGVGYNVQSVVDAETHLIVTHEATNQGHDRHLLARMATQAKAALQREDMHVLADKGYFSALEILACHKAGIPATVPRSDTSGARSKGHFVKADFACDPDADIQRCPAGRALIAAIPGQAGPNTAVIAGSTRCRPPQRPRTAP